MDCASTRFLGQPHLFANALARELSLEKGTLLRVNDLWISSDQTLEKAMAPHSSTLAWKIPWTVEPGRQQSMGSLRVGHN